jgi:diguanylate cyclase (GGDEF)-like protein/PAS domain S-box-containing protein
VDDDLGVTSRRATVADRAPRRPRRPRLTRRVFWDLAVYMVGLGLAVGAIFPSFAVAMGVDEGQAHRPAFVGACLAAGFLVGAASYALCRAVVGGRLAVLSAHLNAVAEAVAQAFRTGDWTASRAGRIEVDSDDELGETARAFNRLIDTLEAGEHFRSLVRNASDIITVVDPAGTITYQTPSVGWVLGHPPDALRHTDVADLVHPDDAVMFRGFLDAAVHGSAQQPSLVCRMRHRNGTWRWVETVAGNLLTDPAVNGVVLTTRDVSDRKELEDQLRAQAFHDPLTGMPNRAMFMDRLRAAEDRHRLAGTPFAVLFLDIDDLKTVNDSLGHDVGDTLLQAVSARLQGCLRPGDVAARLAGDEFAVLLAGTGTAAHATGVSERILASLREPLHLGDRYVHIGLSIGVSTSETAAATEIGLLRAADVAMYVAKTSGKGRYEVFQGSHHASQLEAERLRADLHHALDANQLELHYQPIVRLSTGDVVGHEALLRWNHPRRGLVPPADFIPLAEESGLIVPIGRWVTREATRQAAQWQRGGGPALRMSVNVSAQQFQHPGFVWDVSDALERSGLDPHQLVLEITESVLVQDAGRVAGRLRRLRAIGVRVALDDFGTGYSSLSYLRRFPIDVLKIDKSFVDDIATSHEARAVVGAIVQLGRTLDLEVVAEGVEDAGQVLALAGLSCPLGQGYRFGRPVPAPDALGVPTPSPANELG